MFDASYILLVPLFKCQQECERSKLKRNFKINLHILDLNRNLSTVNE